MGLYAAASNMLNIEIWCALHVYEMWWVKQQNSDVIYTKGSSMAWEQANSSVTHRLEMWLDVVTLSRSGSQMLSLVAFLDIMFWVVSSYIQ